MCIHLQASLFIGLSFGTLLLSSFLPRNSVAIAANDTAIPELDEKGIAMVYVPSGEFTMGMEIEKAIELCLSAIPEEFQTLGCNPDTYPGGSLSYVIEPTKVSVEAFYIDQYEVSLRSYLDCIDADVCERQSLGLQLIDSLDSGDILPLDNPVQRVSYFRAAVYCAWREARLPTEAEWEYASRGSENFFFPWGNEFDPTNLNFRMGSEPRPYPVVSFETGQSWVGAYNLAGNIAEWTSTQLENSAGIIQYTIRITKGGSYLSFPHETTGWARMPLSEQFGIPEGIGFRCVRSILS